MKDHTVANNVKDNLSLDIEVIHLKASYGKWKLLENLTNVLDVKSILF